MIRLRTRAKTEIAYAMSEKHFTKRASRRFLKKLVHREDRNNAKALVAEYLENL
jgi:hypothetical protein